jgi:hypothetical protein
MRKDHATKLQENEKGASKARTKKITGMGKMTSKRI